MGVQAADRKSGVNDLTPALFGPEKLGQWVHLAVVFDGAKGQVTQYVDGREVSRESIAQKIALHPGAAQLGNWSHSRPPKSQPIRNFSGRIEEFILFGAAWRRRRSRGWRNSILRRCSPTNDRRPHWVRDGYLGVARCGLRWPCPML